MKIEISNFLTTFEQLYNDYLTTCKAKGLSEKTVQSYATHLKYFGKYLDLDTPIEDLTQKHLEQMVNQMRDNGLSPNTIRSYHHRKTGADLWLYR